MQESLKIPMTAPVIQQMMVDNWIVRFVMPSNFMLSTLPKPNNPAVTLIEIPSKKYVVIRFSGSNSNANLQNHLDNLQIYCSQNKLDTVANSIMAFYNPPWILPFIRRNEIMFELRE